jgi:hypothetical protein
VRVTVIPASSISDGAASSAPSGDERAQAQARIAEVERVIGRQQVGIDFFLRSLAAFGRDPPSGIATNSSRSLKREASQSRKASPTMTPTSSGFAG